MFQGMEWLPYEEWLSKTGITQLGKERANGTYCRGLENSHTNLMALRVVQQCRRVWKCAGDVFLTFCLGCDLFILLFCFLSFISPLFSLFAPF